MAGDKPTTRRLTSPRTLSSFAIVGVAATATYFVMANCLILTRAVEPELASVLAYGAGMIVSFLGQSRFTFGVSRRTPSQFARFCVMSVAGLAISYACVHIAEDILGIHPSWGTVAAAILVPAMSFLTMHFWVFAREETTQGDRRHG